ncbi:MAG: riboflavin biosynthesis protein RibF, partial [Clostridia bacterium]|nr:riboflavin biosynthesis protein RibF [Clostridia bacterium]
MTDTALVLGTFDGLHTAHKKVLSAANGAKKRVAVIFSVPPSMVMSGRTELLQTVEEKIEMF